MTTVTMMTATNVIAIMMEVMDARQPYQVCWQLWQHANRGIYPPTCPVLGILPQPLYHQITSLA
jgi:hypothetical protein